jgi:methylmalonyl-CoA mutase
VSTRRCSIVGTNQYPNPAERALPRIEREDPTPRAASAFEQIRLRTERHAARTGHTPRFLLLEAGDLKMRQARSAFATSFFGCAGFEIQTSNTLTGDPDVIVADYPADGSNAVEVLRALQERLGVKD